jgi:hypothetical protein
MNLKEGQSSSSQDALLTANNELFIPQMNNGIRLTAKANVKSKPSVPSLNVGIIPIIASSIRMNG